MRRGRTLIFVVVIVVIVVGLGIAFVVFSQLTKPEPVKQTSVEVYIALQPIPQGGKITQESLTTMKIPQENAIAVMFTLDEKAALINKIAKFPLDQGVVITESMVSDSSSSVAIAGPQWAALIPPGMTAMAIPSSRLTLSANAIAKGAHVNINACFLFVDVDPAFQTILPNTTASLSSTGFLPDTLTALTLGVDPVKGGPQGRVELDPSLQQPYYLIPSELRQRPRLVCQMLLQDIVVMGVGDWTPAPAPAAPGSTPVPAPAAKPAAGATTAFKQDTATLIVTPQDSIALTYLMYTDAQITMTLRNPSDQARQATEATTLQFLLSQYNIPVPAKLPYSTDMNFRARTGAPLDDMTLKATNPLDVPLPRAQPGK